LNAPSRSVFATGFDVCVGIVGLRKGPEDLPASTALLAVAVAGGVLLRVLTLAVVPELGTAHPLPAIAVSIAATMLYLLLVLRLANNPERFTQTATAMFGVQIVLAPALLGSAWFFLTFNEDPAWRVPAVLLRLVVEIWVLVIVTRILRSATEWPLFACVALAIAGELLVWLAVESLFPTPQAAADAA
jgi:hypothetical protein